MAIKQISPQEALEMAKLGTVFVDVREKNETDFLSYDLANIIYLPLSEFESLYLTKIPKDKNTEIILACRSGGRSMRVAQVLEDQGYSNLFNLSGGILDWSALQLPCISKE